MRSAWQYLLLLAACSSGLSASSLLTCSFDGGSFSTAGCYTSPTFHTVETVDWLTALGPANQGFHSTSADDPSSYWNYTTPNGVGVSVTMKSSEEDAANALLRVDNFYRYYDSSTGLWRAYNWMSSPYSNYATYMGMFDSAPDGAAGSPGDHLIHTNGQDPLEIQFDQGINGVMFRISTPTGTDVNAIIKAYAVANPTDSDIPIATYAINATNAAGLCAGLDNGSVVAPVPCNMAPYIGIEGRPGDIRSVVISSTDPDGLGGLYISSLFLDETVTRDPGNDTSIPEPGTFALFSGPFVVLGAALRRRFAANR